MGKTIRQVPRDKMFRHPKSSLQNARSLDGIMATITEAGSSSKVKPAKTSYSAWDDKHISALSDKWNTRLI